MLSGEIPDDGIVSVLRDIEDLRTTGALWFKAGDLEGEVLLVRGQIAMDQQELPDGGDPLDKLLELRNGDYSVIQRLPPLAVSQGDDDARRGSLMVHVAADLMNYCEGAGLTGVLRLTREERVAEVVYDRGELVGIQLDGEDDADLNEVFGWEDGEFVIEAQGATAGLSDDPFEREPTKQFVRLEAPEGDRFLKVVEVALVDIVQKRESCRPPARQSPKIEPLGEARPATDRPGPSRSSRPRPATVKIVYLKGDGARPSHSTGTRHVRADVTASYELPEAAPERRSVDSVAKSAVGDAAMASPEPSGPSSSNAGEVVFAKPGTAPQPGGEKASAPNPNAGAKKQIAAAPPQPKPGPEPEPKPKPKAGRPSPSQTRAKPGPATGAGAEPKGNPGPEASDAPRPSPPPTSGGKEEGAMDASGGDDSQATGAEPAGEPGGASTGGGGAKAPPAPPSMAGTLGWALVVVLLCLAAMSLLSVLPQLK